ncbi:Probable tRNA (guanine(26)-N(2))-dimethyltransferase 2 [Linum perenne]
MFIFSPVDLDPYGSPAVFLDSAIQSVADGGILMCTATDMVVLCGNNGEVCYSKYGSYPLRGKYCHEMALRILLASIESHGDRYKRYIVPVLSVQMDFYVRVFVRIYTSAGAMKNTPLKLSYIYQCVGCDSFHLQPIGRTLPKVCVFLH